MKKYSPFVWSSSIIRGRLIVSGCLILSPHLCKPYILRQPHCSYETASNFQENSWYEEPSTCKKASYLLDKNLQKKYYDIFALPLGDKCIVTPKMIVPSFFLPHEIVIGICVKPGFHTYVCTYLRIRKEIFQFFLCWIWTLKLNIFR